MDQNVGDALACPSVPEVGCGACFDVARECLRHGVDDHMRVRTDDRVRSHGDRHGAFGVWSHRESRNPGYRGLFLESPGIGEHMLRTRGERQEVEVAQGLGELEIRHRVCTLNERQLLE